MIKLTNILKEILSERQNIKINLDDADELDFSESDEIMFVYDIIPTGINPDSWGDDRVKFSIPIQTIKDLLYNQSKDQENVSLKAYGIEDENINWTAILDKETAASIIDSYYENYPDEMPFGLNEMIKLTDVAKEILLEDRCKRIADRKYSKPSAYKSGAIVRCRKGNIWKDIKEELDELYIQHKQPLGGESAEGEAYDAITHPGKVIKIYTWVDIESKYAQYNLMKNYPKFFVKIYKMTPKYIVMEKIKTPISGLKELQSFNQIEGIYRGDIIRNMYEEIQDGKEDKFNIILDALQGALIYHKRNNNLTSYTHISKMMRLLNKLHTFFLELKKEVPQLSKYNLDIHSGNIGEDEQGNLKLFDISYEGAINEKQKETLRTWFKRKGAPGKTGGWVDCNTCREVDGKKKCKPCGRQKGEKRAKYPSCRPTPSQCGDPGKGKSWGKTK